MAERVASTVRSAALFAEAQQLLPGGVDSPVRAFRAVGGTPRFIARGKGAHGLGRRRQRLHRLPRLLGPADRRPRPPWRGRRDSGGRSTRHQLRRPVRGRAGAGQTGQASVPEHRPGALRQLRHRGDHERAAPRARLHRPRHDPQVRRRLPRPRRRPAGPGRLGPADLRPTRLARRARNSRGRKRSRCPTTTCRPSETHSPRTRTRSPRSSSSPSPATWAWSHPSLAFSNTCAA